jgi:SAM-dependent methyltransferase
LSARVILEPQVKVEDPRQIIGIGSVRFLISPGFAIKAGLFSMKGVVMDNNSVYEWILQTTFTVSARVKSFQLLEPYLSTIIRPGDQVLDLCCGSGPMSFWFEEQGAKVTGIDFAPYMIELANEEAASRNSTVEFIETDIFTQDFGHQQFDLISCFGNSISDFPLSDFAVLGRKIANALKPGGRFVVQYHDGSYEAMQGITAPEGVYQEVPERVTFRSNGYSTEIGARLVAIRNETRGEEYERKSFIYTVPVVGLAMSDALEHEQHIILEENHFLDVFISRGSASLTVPERD